MSVDVDSLGLATSGIGLIGEQAPLAPTAVTPPSDDPISAYAAAVLSTQWLRLSLVASHGSLQKAVGGMAVLSTGAGFEAQDKLNVGLFDQLGELASELASMASGVGSPSLPDLLAIPSAPPPPVMPPQVFSELLFAGPGSSVLRQQADLLRGQAGAQRADADQATAAGSQINSAWDDGGQQQAGANTTKWGAWKHDSVDDMDTLATSLDSFADANDRARQDTPSPDQYQRAFAQLSAAMQSGNPVAAAQAAAHISELNAKGGEAMTAYYNDVIALTTALNTTLKTAPPIAGGGKGGDQGGSGQQQGAGQQRGAGSSGETGQGTQPQHSGPQQGPPPVGSQPGAGTRGVPGPVPPPLPGQSPGAATAGQPPKTWQDMMLSGFPPGSATSAGDLINPSTAPQPPNGPMGTDPLSSMFKGLIGPAAPQSPVAAAAAAASSSNCGPLDLTQGVLEYGGGIGGTIVSVPFIPEGAGVVGVMGGVASILDGSKILKECAGE
jgi:hypothetical protein